MKRERYSENKTSIQDILNETLRYIKLTRAFILLKMEKKRPGLDLQQKNKISLEVESIKKELNLTAEEFASDMDKFSRLKARESERCQKILENISTSLQVADAPEFAEESLLTGEINLRSHCFNKLCRHQENFTMSDMNQVMNLMNRSVKCSKCEGNMAIMVNGGQMAMFQ